MKQHTGPAAASRLVTKGPAAARRLVAKGAAAALATATAATLAGMAASPAASVTGSACPAPFPVASLAKGQPVTGLTVTEGTTPGGFTGKVLGVLDDGVMPGIDMIMVRLGSADGSPADRRIDEVGIWAGMSGSPVYAADGRLIGAVSYGLSYGPSPVAGVTPAADMAALLDSGTGPGAAPAEEVQLTPRLQARVVDSGAATDDQADSGLSQLDLPFGVSGLGPRRFKQVSAKVDIPGTRMVRMGTATSGQADASSIVTGGNLAAAIAYGDITYAGVGTVSMVCGEDVVGFGHPMMWSGPTGLSLHPADAIYIQEDPAWAGFKVANIGAPVGTIDQDRMAGIAGFVGDLPATGTVTSHVSGPTGERTGQTAVNLADWMPEISLSQLLATEDRIFDGYGEGSGTVSYVVVGTREDGTPFSLTRSDVYADRDDLTWATAWDLYSTLSRLEYNRTEDITIDTVRTDSHLDRSYRHAAIDDVLVQQGDRWISLDGRRRLVLPAGSTTQLKVQLLSDGSGPSEVLVDLPIRRRDSGKQGWLEVAGGNAMRGSFGGRNAPLDKLLDRIESAPHNDDVVTTVGLYGMQKSRHTTHQTQTVSTDGLPVDGSIGVRLRIMG